MSSWPAKDPDEVLDYDIDWTKRLYSADELAQYNAAIGANPALADADPSTVVMPAETIATSQFTLPPGIVADSSSSTTRMTKIWLSGGTVGVSYLILNRIVTAGGRTMDQSVKLKIKAK